MTLATVILTSILSLLFVAYASFAYRYYRYSPWNATWQGVTLFSQKLTLAALVGFFIGDTIVEGVWPGRTAVLLILLTLLLVEAWATFAGLLHVQRATRPVPERQGIGYAEPEDIEHDEHDASRGSLEAERTE